MSEPPTIRRAFVACWLLAFAAGCSESVAQPPPPPVNWQSFSHPVVDAGAGPTAKESTIAQEYASALASPGFAQLGHLLHEDAHFAFPGMDDAYGREPVVRAHEVLFGAFDQRRFALNRVWRSASQQALEWTLSGVQARDWMGVKAAQKPVTIRGLTLLSTRDDGTIADAHLYFDVAVVKALLGGGPKELADVPAPAMPSEPTQFIDQTPGGPDNFQPVRRALDAIENNDESAYLAEMADDVEFRTLEHPEPVRGKEERRAYFKALHKAIAQIDTTVESSWSAGPYAIVEHWMAGEQIGPLGWVPMQPDHVVKLHVADVVEVKNDKITSVWRYDNSAEANAPGP